MKKPGKRRFTAIRFSFSLKGAAEAVKSVRALFAGGPYSKQWNGLRSSKFNPAVSLYAIPTAAEGLRTFVAAWTYSRRWILLCSGVFPLSVSLLLLWSLLAYRLPGRRQAIIENYRSAAQAAVESGDTAAYRLNFRRFLEMSRGGSQLQFEFASTLYDLGETDEAMRMMSGLAPVKYGGYEPAHRFLVAHIASGKSAQMDLLRAVHLSHIIRRNSDARPERLQLVQLLAGHRNYQLAEKLLRPTLDRFPEDSLTIARLKVRTGNIEAARSDAQHACEILRSIVANEPDNTQRRIQLAQGYVFLARSGQALDVLCEALPKSTDAPIDASVIDAMSKTYGVWLSLLPVRQRTIQRICLSQLSDVPVPEAVTVAQNPDDSAQSGAEIFGTPEPTDSVFFAAVIRSPHRRVVVPFLQGTIAGADGNLFVAEERLRIALSYAPDSPSIKNNLAWILQLDLKNVSDKTLRAARCHEALQLAAQAVEAFPQIQEFSETHAAILAASGQDGLDSSHASE